MNPDTTIPVVTADSGDNATLFSVASDFFSGLAGVATSLVQSGLVTVAPAPAPAPQPVATVLSPAVKTGLTAAGLLAVVIVAVLVLKPRAK